MVMTVHGRAGGECHGEVIGRRRRYRAASGGIVMMMVMMTILLISTDMVMVTANTYACESNTACYYTYPFCDPTTKTCTDYKSCNSTLPSDCGDGTCAGYIGPHLL